MGSETDGRELLGKEDLPAEGGAESGRREFLRQLAVVGAGAAGLTLLSQQEAAADLLTESIRGTYTVNTNFVISTLRIEGQSGSTFIGRFSDGTRVNGTVAGARPGTIAITFTRLLSDGTAQIYFGAVALRRATPNNDALMAGTFYHNGAGPVPWIATGSAVP